MCKLCTSVSNSSYKRDINDWLKRDIPRLNASKELAQENKILQNALFSNIKYPFTIDFPLFESCAAYAVPTNYFQNLFIDNERMRGDWAHDATRAIAFIKAGLLLISKFVVSKAGKEWLSHFLMLLLSKDEYRATIDEFGNITIAAKVQKTMENLATGKFEPKAISFNFVHKPTAHATVSRQEALASGKIREIYGRAKTHRLAESRFEAYIITVPHFSPHPYLLNDYAHFGYASRAEFQHSVGEYFKAHIQ